MGLVMSVQNCDLRKLGQCGLGCRFRRVTERLWESPGSVGGFGLMLVVVRKLDLWTGLSWVS